MSNLADVEYIVTEEKILNAVRYGLEFIINDDTIVRKFMRPIEKQIGDMLDDECEEWRGENNDRT